MVDFNVEEIHDLYSYQREYNLARGQMPVRYLIQKLLENEIVVIQKLQKFKWNRDEFKSLIFSLHKGVPIGEITMWELRAGSPILRQQR